MNPEMLRGSVTYVTAWLDASLVVLRRHITLQRVFVILVWHAS